MADKIVIELDLEKGDVIGATRALDKAGKEAGQKAGNSFSKAFNQDISSGLKSITTGALKAAGAIGSIATAYLGFKAINAAQVQEDAINSLNSALSISKNSSLAASEGIQAFASELQKSTRFGDEVLLQNAALIQSLGDLDEEGLKRATRATADLATALRIDLTSAATLVGKAAAGEVGSFSRYGLSIKKGANNAETFARALTAIEGKFGGAAQRDIQTYSGAVEQLSNTFGDVLEEFGNLIIKNPLVLRGVNQLNAVFLQAGNSVKEFASTFNVIDDALIPLSNFADGIITFVVSPLELLKNIFSIAQNSLNFFVSGFIAGIGDIAGTVASFISLVSPGSETASALNNFAESSKEVFNDVTNDLTNSLSSVVDFPIADKLATKNEEFRIGLQSLNATILEESTIAQENLNGSLVNQNNELNNNLDQSAKNLADKLKETQKQVNSIVNQGIARGISGGIQNIISSLANGENAFQNFGSFLLNTFGDLAIQLGQFFIAQGIAIEALNAVSGTGAIAAGAALVALGSIIKSFSSSGGSSASGGGVAAVGATAAPGELSSELASPEQQTRAEERTNVTINVEGSMVRESELAGFIADTLETAGSSNSTIIPSLRTGIA